MNLPEWVRRYGRQKAALTAFIFLLLLFTASAVIPFLSPYTYEMQEITRQNEGMSMVHLLGTDRLGRDLLVRIAEGVRISLLVGGAGAGISLVFGVLYGGIAGYYQGTADLVMMRIADILYSIPSLLYIILIMLAAGPGIVSVTAGICVAGWIETARITRSQIMREKTKDYYLAAKFAGASEMRILFIHFMPNITGPVIVSGVYTMIQAIFTEAFLSFAGVGIAAPRASLGTLIQDARSQITTHPMQMVWPAAVLCLIVFSLHCISEGIKKAASPVKRGDEGCMH